MKAYIVTITQEGAEPFKHLYLGMSSGEVEFAAHEKFGWLSGIAVQPC